MLGRMLKIFGFGSAAYKAAVGAVAPLPEAVEQELSRRNLLERQLGAMAIRYVLSGKGSMVLDRIRTAAHHRSAFQTPYRKDSAAYNEANAGRQVRLARGELLTLDLLIRYLEVIDAALDWHDRSGLPGSE